MTTAARRTILYVVIIALAGIVLCVAWAAAAHAAPADTCDPASAQCCACEPSNAAEPDPLPHLYLPSVQRSMPPMTSEFTPVQPVPTVTPDPPVTGDVQ